jgi:O6-methylguanine-DNA--protein-cysteine methyltransferase
MFNEMTQLTEKNIASFFLPDMHRVIKSTQKQLGFTKEVERKSKGEKE